MDYFYIALVLIIVAMGAWIWRLAKDKAESEREVEKIEKEKNEYAEMGKGLAEYNRKLQEKKNQAKNKILEILKTKAKVSNRDVAEKLDISSASVRRYFDELEAEGKAKQVGKDGKDVFYTAI